MQIRFTAETGGLLLADGDGLVEAEHGGTLAGTGGNEEIGPHEVVRLGSVLNLAANEAALERHFLELPDLERSALSLAGHGAHDGLHAGENVAPADRPVLERFHRLPCPVGVEVVGRVLMIRIFGAGFI